MECEYKKRWCVYNYKERCYYGYYYEGWKGPVQPSREGCFDEEGESDKFCFLFPFFDGRELFEEVYDLTELLKVKDRYEVVKRFAVANDPNDRVSVASCQQVKESAEYQLMIIEGVIDRKMVRDEEPTLNEEEKEIVEAEEEEQSKEMEREVKEEEGEWV
jgi:hypothetical protein